MAGYVDGQDAKNVFLKQEIVDALDKEIVEIKGLREQAEALLSRKQVIESLQTNRTETVQLFNELVRQMPEGVYLKALKQSGAKNQSDGLCPVERAGFQPDAQSRGVALSRARRSRRGQGRHVLNTRRVSEFNLNVSVERAKTEDSGASRSPAEVVIAGGKP